MWHCNVGDFPRFCWSGTWNTNTPPFLWITPHNHSIMYISEQTPVRYWTSAKPSTRRRKNRNGRLKCSPLLARRCDRATMAMKCGEKNIKIPYMVLEMLISSSRGVSDIYLLTCISNAASPNWRQSRLAFCCQLAPSSPSKWSWVVFAWIMDHHGSISLLVFPWSCVTTHFVVVGSCRMVDPWISIGPIKPASCSISSLNRTSHERNYTHPHSDHCASPINRVFLLQSLEFLLPPKSQLSALQHQI